MNKVTQTAPKEIYLCVSDDELDANKDFVDTWDIVWANDAATAVTVRYIRADLCQPLVTKPVALPLTEQWQILGGVDPSGLPGGERSAAVSAPQPESAYSKPAKELLDFDCNPHPDAPHGFDRNGSHNNGRYTCVCEGWVP